MTQYAYLFEAHSIQRFILDSGRMAEMVGASDLVESLTAESGLLDHSIEALGIPEPAFLRRTAGVFTALLPNEDTALTLRDAWSLLIAQYAPGLTYSHIISKGNTALDAVEAGQRQLRIQKNRHFVTHPLAGPTAQRSPRTGIPAVALGTEFDERDVNTTNAREWVDQASYAKSQKRFRKTPRLAEKYNTPTGYEWPTLLSPDETPDTLKDSIAFPLKGDNRYVGVVHADGNNLGSIVRTLSNRLRMHPELYQISFLAFSQAIENATRCAAAQATERVLKPIADLNERVFPARPLVLGGDDLTVIVRGDCALNYATAFIEGFEQFTATAFDSLRSKASIFSDLPKQLTACAGVAFIKASQPFYLAYRLADDLCRHAKQRSSGTSTGSEPHPSAITFSRITTSFIDRYAPILKNELTINDGSVDYQMTLGGYSIGGIHSTLPQFSELRQLKDFLAKPGMARGASRQLLTLLQSAPREAQHAYARWQQNLTITDERNGTHLAEDFKLRLEALGIPRDAALPYRDANGSEDRPPIKATPLGDVLAWLAIDGSIEDNQDD